MRHRLVIIPTLLIALVAVPLVVQAQTSKAEQPVKVLVVEESTAQLQVQGCEVIDQSDTAALRAAQAIGWQLVIPEDLQDGQIVTCSPVAAGSLSLLTEGQVAPYQAFGNLYRLLNLASGGRIGSAVGEAGTNLIMRNLAKIFKFIFEFIGSAGGFVFNWAVDGLPSVISLSEFATNYFVVNAWPMVLGVVNLGFLIALVFIALLVALQLDQGTGLRRLLPRLFIAALLVNFSLVIAVVVLDLTQLSMGLLTIAFQSISGVPATATGASVTDLEYFADSLKYVVSPWSLRDDFTSAAKSLAASAQTKTTFTLNTYNFEEALGYFLYALVIWAVAFSAMVIVFGLIMRYILILILLVLSPFAYLFMAFPNTTGLAKKWWSSFLRYTFYAPAVLAILLMIAISRFQSDPLGLAGSFDLTDDIDRATYDLIRATIVATGFIMAAQAGKYAGIVGSATALNLASGANKRVRKVAGAPVTLPARGVRQAAKKTTKAAGKLLGKQSVDFLGAAAGNIGTQLGMKRSKKSLATRAADAVVRPESPQARQYKKEARQTRQQLDSGAITRDQMVAGISPVQLRHKNVKQELGRGFVNYAAENTDSAAKVRAINKKDYLKDLNENERTDLYMSIQANVKIDPSEKQKVLSELMKNLEDIDNE